MRVSRSCGPVDTSQYKPPLGTKLGTVKGLVRQSWKVLQQTHVQNQFPAQSVRGGWRPLPFLMFAHAVSRKFVAGTFAPDAVVAFVVRVEVSAGTIDQVCVCLRSSCNGNKLASG